MTAASTEIETSIVIRTLNEERHLERLLEGIRAQTYTSYEIIVVDSGSTDGTLDIARRYTDQILHIAKEDFTFGRSLNRGCQEARGQYLVFLSAHTYPLNNTWIGNLVRPFEDATIGMVYGRQRGVKTSRVAEARDLERLFGLASKILIDEPYGHNGNAAVRRALWLEQPFDEELTGLEDLDWARRIQPRGYRIYYAADSAVYHVHQETLRQLYRRFFREAIAYRHIMPGYRLRAWEVTRGLLFNILGDLAYAIRRRASFRQCVQVPASRMVEYWATWRGLSSHQRLTRALLYKLYYPTCSESVVVQSAGSHGLMQIPLDPVGADEVLIQVGFVGVCATDLDVAAGALTYYHEGQARYPIVPGHEYSGLVVAVGADVAAFRKGDKVVGECVMGCGDCSACAREEFYRCTQRTEVGVINRNGAYARYLTIPARYIHKLPREVSLKEAALIEPIAVALKGLRKLNVQAGRSACIIGAGPLGNFCAQILKYRGVTVTIIDRDERRLKLLHKYDVNTQQGVVGLRAFDYLIDATGNHEVIPHLIEESRPSAKILLLGLPYPQPVTVSFSSVPCYDKEIIGSIASERRDWQEAIQLLRSGILNLEDHTATVLPLESYEAAWAGVQDRRHFKVLLACNTALARY